MDKLSKPADSGRVTSHMIEKLSEDAEIVDFLRACIRIASSKPADTPTQPEGE